MRLLLTLAAAIFALIPAAAMGQSPAGTAASGTVWICHEANASPCQGYFAVKPGGISFDRHADLSAGSLKWSHWGDTKATATGKSLSRTVFKEYTMKLTATKIGACNGVLAYTHLSVKYRGTTTVYTGCPLNKKH